MRLRGLLPPKDEIIQAELFPGRIGPLYPNKPGQGWAQGMFGLMPPGAKDDLFRSTFNARSETVAEKWAFRNAWRQRRLCLIPCEALFEQNYESGKSARWRIERADGEPFAIAGLWETRQTGKSEEWSYSMLTINADEHPLMKLFRAPGKEKRSVVILPDSTYEAWLSAKAEEDVRAFLKPFDPEEFIAAPEPIVREKVSDDMAHH